MVFFVKLELEISCRVCGEEASNHCFKAAICWILHYELTERISAYCAAQKKSVSEQSRVPDLQLGSTTMADDGGRQSMASPAPKKRAIASSSFITSSPMNPSAKKQRGGRTAVSTGRPSPQ
jgi:hypothetical protein